MFPYDIYTLHETFLLVCRQIKHRMNTFSLGVVTNQIRNLKKAEMSETPKGNFHFVLENHSEVFISEVRLLNSQIFISQVLLL